MNGDFSITVNRVGFETDPDTPVHVERVPEPSTFGLLALGAAGVAAFRRRRKEQPPASA